MKVGFFHVDLGDKSSEWGALCARALVRSCRKSMPTVSIVQFTDMDTKAVKGVDEVRRKPSEPMALLRMRHHAGVDGDWLFVDTDVIVQKSVKKVFRREFDVAITTRNWAHLKVAVGFSESMPFNTGVMFSRKPSFWAEVYTRLRLLSPEKQQWMGDQEVICDMVTDDACRYDVRYLKGSRYNYPPPIPVKVEEGQSAASIIHYKGPSRKPMLLERLKREMKRCA